MPTLLVAHILKAPFEKEQYHKNPPNIIYMYNIMHTKTKTGNRRKAKNHGKKNYVVYISTFLVKSHLPYRRDGTQALLLAVSYKYHWHATYNSPGASTGGTECTISAINSTFGREESSISARAGVL